MKARETILITGAAGGLSHLMTEKLKDKYDLIGVDPRPLDRNNDFPGEFYRLFYDHRRMREVFQNHKIDYLLHLGRVRVTSTATSGVRFRVNVMGTRNLLDLSQKFGVKRNIILSTFHVYGAHARNPSHLTEDDPLRASQTFPELADAVEMDHVASTFMWKNPKIETVILRPVNVIGKSLNNSISRLFKGKYSPTFIGFDPLIQFIHETDFAEALQLCISGEGSGIYNVAGEGAVAFSKALEICGTTPIPIPIPQAIYLIKPFLFQNGMSIPMHLLEYFKYPAVISDTFFREQFGFTPKVSTLNALKELR